MGTNRVNPINHASIPKGNGGVGCPVQLGSIWAPCCGQRLDECEVHGANESVLDGVPDVSEVVDLPSLARVYRA